MKSFILLFILISFAVEAQFSSETTKKIDTIENNTATDITINPTNQVVIPYLTSGELVVDDGTGLQSFANGTEGQLLSITSGVLGFIDPPASSPLTTKGDIYTYDVDNQRLSVGTDGQLLSADSVEATGLKWIDPPVTTPTTTEGDLILRGATEDIRLPIGTTDYLLTSDGTTASWQPAPVSTTLDTKGQIQTYSTENAALDVGLDGTFLVADSTEPTGLKYTASLQGKLSPVIDTVDGVCTSTHTTNVITTCKYSRLGDKAIIEWKNTYTGTTNTANLEFSMPDGLVIDAAKVSGTVSTVSIIGKGTAINDGGSSYPISVVYIDSSNVGARIANTTFTYTVNTNRVTATTPVNPLSTSDSVVYSAILPIQGWTSGLDAAVQDIQLTAATANELSARIANSGGTATLTSFNYDFIDTVTDNSGTSGLVDIVWNAGIFTEAPSITATVADVNGDRLIVVESVSTTGTSLRVKNGVNTNIDENFNIKVSKQGADVNKSQVIAGTFENIDSTDLCQVVASSNDSNLISGGIEDIPWKTIEKDNCNSWSNAGNTGADTPDAYTANKDSMVAFNMVIYINAATDSEIASYINGVEYKRHGVQVGVNRPKFNGRVPLEKDDVLTFRFINGRTLSNGLGDLRHHIAITELPDYEAIVKNLYADNVTECTTKILQADTSALGVVSDLSFDNLVVGEKYSFDFKGRSNASGQQIIFNSEVLNDNRVGRTWYGDSGDSSVSESLRCFVAVDNDLRVNNALAINLYGDGSRDESKITICKLPDTTICTE